LVEVRSRLVEACELSLGLVMLVVEMSSGEKRE